MPLRIPTHVPDMELATQNFDIPNYDEDTAEILEWIGFTREVALERFETHEQWVHEYDFMPEDYIDWSFGQVEGMDSRLAGLSDDERMRQVGIRKPVRDAILHPDFKKLFQTQTLEYWVKDTLRINYHTVEILNHRQKSTSAYDRRDRRRREDDSNSEALVTVNIDPEKYKLPKTWFKARGERPPVPSGHTRLWKARAGAEVESAMPHRRICEEGRVDVQCLAGEYEGDFNYLDQAYYFHKDEEIAELSRRYIETRCPWADTWLISIDVPDSYLNSLTKAELWYAEEIYNDWKYYIWACVKHGEMLMYWELPTKDNTDFVVGHMTAKNYYEKRAVKDDEIETKIDDDWTLKLENGERATQFVFFYKGPNFLFEMARQIAGKVHADITSSWVMRTLERYDAD